MANKNVFRVAVIGFGAIGKRVAESVRDGVAPGAELVGVVVRTAGPAAEAGYRELDLDIALAEADLLVECAGGHAVREMGPRIVEAGKDLLIVSVGALADDVLRATLLEGGPGRTYLSTGAIGGLDVLRAAALGEGNGPGLDEASITTTKLPGTLVQPWMDDAEATKLRSSTEPVTVFRGSVQEAIKRFPNSLNIAVALAAATNLWEHTTVHLMGDPSATRTSHRIEAHGSSGRYSFDIANHPLAANPASSGIVSQALVSGIARLSQPSGSFV